MHQNVNTGSNLSSSKILSNIGITHISNEFVYYPVVFSCCFSKGKSQQCLGNQCEQMALYIMTRNLEISYCGTEYILFQTFLSKWKGNNYEQPSTLTLLNSYHVSVRWRQQLLFRKLVINMSSCSVLHQVSVSVLRQVWIIEI